MSSAGRGTKRRRGSQSKNNPKTKKHRGKTKSDTSTDSKRNFTPSSSREPKRNLPTSSNDIGKISSSPPISRKRQSPEPPSNINERQKTVPRKRQKKDPETNEYQKELDKLELLHQKAKSEEHRKLSSETEKGKKILELMNDRQLESWATSLGKTARALEVENLVINIKVDIGRRSKHPLKNALFALRKVIGDLDQGPQGSGVGSPGFTKEKTKEAKDITAKAAHEYILKTILGDKGKEVREKNRKNPNEFNKDEASKMIRRIIFEDAGKNEMHAIGLGNDVLAASWVKEIRHAAPYSEVAVQIDEIAESIGRKKVVDLIGYYARLNGFTKKPDLEKLTAKDGAKLREFATIQIAEKGRELKRAQEAETDDKGIVEKALNNARDNSFYHVYVQQTADLAPFAGDKGQDQLRQKYKTSTKT